MHPNVSIIVGAAILRVKDALEWRTSVVTEIVSLPARIDVSHQKYTLLTEDKGDKERYWKFLMKGNTAQLT